MLRERMCHVLGDPIPGDSIHDLLLHDRWMSVIQPLQRATNSPSEKGRQQN